MKDFIVFILLKYLILVENRVIETLVWKITTKIVKGLPTEKEAGTLYKY